MNTNKLRKKFYEKLNSSEGFSNDHLKLKLEDHYDDMLSCYRFKIKYLPESEVDFSFGNLRIYFGTDISSPRFEIDTRCNIELYLSCVKLSEQSATSYLNRYNIFEAVAQISFIIGVLKDTVSSKNVVMILRSDDSIIVCNGKNNYRINNKQYIEIRNALCKYKYFLDLEFESKVGRLPTKEGGSINVEQNGFSFNYKL